MAKKDKDNPPLLQEDETTTSPIDYSDKTQTAQGLFGLENIMSEFYGYKPKEDDAEGRALKNTFASNMIQSAFNDLQATGMAYRNACNAAISLLRISLLFSFLYFIFTHRDRSVNFPSYPRIPAKTHISIIDGV